MSNLFIIPFFIPHAGCSHRCAFCNQIEITRELQRQQLPPPESLVVRIDEWLKYKGSRRNSTQLAFYGGNFLGLERAYLQKLLDEAQKYVAAGIIDSIRFSTRPDTIDAERLSLLKAYRVKTVELGVQSMDDGVLAAVKRGHSAADTVRAVNLLHKSDYEVGLQMMVGLPGDDGAASLATARELAALDPAFVRIYPTVVLAGSALARWYRQGRYAPLALDRCVTLTKTLWQMFSAKGIAVVRMGLQACDAFDKKSVILAGPYHPAFGHLVHAEIFLDQATAVLKRAVALPDSVTLRVHPRDISNMRGQKNSNIESLKTMFQLKSLNIVPDPDLEDSLILMDIP